MATVPLSNPYSLKNATLSIDIDDYSAKFEPPTEFVVPGETKVAALLDRPG